MSLKGILQALGIIERRTVGSIMRGFHLLIDELESHAEDHLDKARDVEDKIHDLVLDHQEHAFEAAAATNTAANLKALVGAPGQAPAEVALASTLPQGVTDPNAAPPPVTPPPSNGATQQKAAA